ncbi:hypothetical protein CEXT_521121 [Caerostris extrusa]|uniref:Uncharacterized protein n=1 Tax=Caerostris extrusa TaxID=172846 RepID=A0AAV4WYJ6_CAEEX|nr:hypothetical protein CEXT_521121 [Caerostris extrusa]
MADKFQLRQLHFGILLRKTEEEVYPEECRMFTLSHDSEKGVGKWEQLLEKNIHVFQFQDQEPIVNLADYISHNVTSRNRVARMRNMRVDIPWDVIPLAFSV